MIINLNDMSYTSFATIISHADHFLLLSTINIFSDTNVTMESH